MTLARIEARIPGVSEEGRPLRRPVRAASEPTPPIGDPDDKGNKPPIGF